LENCDLCGFNILQFDIPLLAQEFARVGIDFNTEKRNLLDAQKIFHMMEKRNLSAAFKFYTGEVLENAHSALADTRATMAVFMGQIAKYDQQTLSNLKGEVLGIIENDMNSLHLLLNKKMVDLAGRMVFNDQGKEVFNFGKHKGKLVSEVLQKESSFYDWMMKGDFPLDTKKKLTQLRLNSFNK
jgi:DNA polymerase-3 subunit epsilon